MKKLFGFSGVARSGKDTAGKYLVENYGYTRVSFADGVRDALYALNPRARVVDIYGNPIYPSIRELVDQMGWEETKQMIEVRELLQRMGTEVGRDLFGENVWVDLAGRKMEDLEKVVITDVRFPNESEFIRESGGLVININNPNVKSINSHISDVPLPSELFDIQIDNDESVEDLYRKLDEVIVNYV